MIALILAVLKFSYGCEKPGASAWQYCTEVTFSLMVK